MNRLLRSRRLGVFLSLAALFALARCGSGSSSGGAEDVFVAADPGSDAADVVGGSCNAAADCDDDNPCTSDFCAQDGRCRHIPQKGCQVIGCSADKECADDDLCTLDQCTKGGCVHNPVVCDDGDPCTDSACKPKVGCVHVPVTSDACAKPCAANADCGDGNPCTVDRCDTGSGVCSYEPLECLQPGAPCIVSRCDPGSGGCVLEPDPECPSCQSDEECPPSPESCGVARCNDGKCAFAPLDCDDGDACTVDGCDPATGQCVNQEVPACNLGCTSDQDCAKEGPPPDACHVGVRCVGDSCVYAVRDCADDHPCTKDFCDPSAGCLHAEIVGCRPPCASAADCDDKNPCTSDICADGVCGHGLEICDDGDPCTQDVCDPDFGCQNTSLLPCPKCTADSACDDQAPCTLDRCVNGGCVHDPDPKCSPCIEEGCDDGNPCTQDVCGEDGACTHDSSAADGEACDDGNPCTLGDLCKGGGCHGLEPNPCDDGDPCTLDSCLLQSGCDHAPSPGCGGACTTNADCNDKNACTGDLCLGGTCVYNEVSCTDGNLCTQDGCDPSSGACVFTPVSGVCDDGDVCTTGDLCKEGGCEGMPTSCDDTDPCTADLCEPLTGACLHTPKPSCGNGCTTDLDCADFFPCTVDSCDTVTGTCTNTPKSCKSGSLCTTGSCDPFSGACVVAPVDCEDGDPCTTDACDPLSGGCAHVPDPICGTKCTSDTDCQDGFPCTVDSCDLATGTCSRTLKTCEDGDPCTVDGCDPQNGSCEHFLVPGCGQVCAAGQPCDDGDPCTVDTCTEAGLCAHEALGCDDGDPCTKDGCDPTDPKGCIHEPIPGCGGQCVEAKACDDNDPCTDDGCLDGACQHVPAACDDGDPCTKDGCDAASGGCVHKPIPGCEPPCFSDTDCLYPKGCLQPGCVNGSCVLLPDPVACDDGDLCTTDSCDPDTGACLNETIPNCLGPCNFNADCDDGSPCTDDICGLDGMCGHTVKSCSDGDDCTADACDPTTGTCEHEVIPNCIGSCKNDASCDDGNVCTDDRCSSNGQCTHSPLNCDDGKPCSMDLCDPKQGCVHPVIPYPSCKCNKDKDCLEGDTCTFDVCLPFQKVCVHLPIPGCN